MESVQQIKASPSAGRTNTVQTSARADARKVQARGMDYAAGQALFAPPGPAAGQRTAGDAAPVQAKEAATKTGEPGGPEASGKTLGQTLVGHMDELNKSPALVDESGKPVAGNNGKYNVGYKPAHPEMPPGAKVITEAGKEPVLVTPENMDPQEEYKFKKAWHEAHDNQHGHVTDVWQEGEDTGKFFVSSNPGSGNRFSWQLKPGASASGALDQWLSKSGDVEVGADGSSRRKDTTVADCASALVAMQLQSLRERVGDANFDKLVKANKSEFFICGDPKKTPLGPFMSEIDLYKSGDKGTIGNRPLTEGDAVYFRNHTSYKQYDPVGLWSGENCVYLGREGGTGPQMFGGFGLPRETEEGINAKLVKAFNDKAPEDKKIKPADLLANGGGLQTTFDPKDDDQRGNSMGLRLDEAKVKKAMGG